jgi:anti-anti-sigma regulatory factor
MIDVSESPDRVKVTISGECDFVIAKEMMLACRNRIKAGAPSRIEVVLDNVTYCNSCIIGASLVLSDMVKGNFGIIVTNSNPQVHQLFEDGQIESFFNDRSKSTVPHDACAGCLQGDCAKPGPHCKKLEALA